MILLLSHGVGLFVRLFWQVVFNLLQRPRARGDVSPLVLTSLKQKTTSSHSQYTRGEIQPTKGVP